MGEQHMSDASLVSAEEWTVIHALRRVGRRDALAAQVASQNDIGGAYRLLENEIFENVGTTLDRMIDRADRTSGELDNLLRRLSETAGSRRSAA